VTQSNAGGYADPAPDNLRKRMAARGGEAYRSAVQVIYRQATGDPAQPRDSREALTWLEEGNRRFSTLAAGHDPSATGGTPPLVIEGDFGVGAVLGQEPEPRPFGVVLGCADSRVPIELVFGRAVNDLFVVRMAGNTIGSDAIGSIEYAVQHFPTVQNVVVLGHTLCGAVATAVDVFLKPRGFLELASSLPLRSLVERIQVGARVASMALQEEYGPYVREVSTYGWALLEVAIFLNAAYVAHSVRAALLADGHSRVAVVYGVYDLATRRVSAGPAAASSFAPPPEGTEGFRELARSLASASRTRDLLRGDVSKASAAHGR
jgi:carbonic anhydrase